LQESAQADQEKTAESDRNKLLKIILEVLVERLEADDEFFQ
jgi:hypothetical protein